MLLSGHRHWRSAAVHTQADVSVEHSALLCQVTGGKE